MRSEWSLKVKEEFEKQLKAGFIKVSEYSDWVANVVPVPKKDVKSKERSGHLRALGKFFQRLRKYNMRLNPQKCAFGVTSGKLLGHIISHRGIELDPSKIKAIMEMPHPETEKEIPGFLGRVQYISCFIAKLTMICEPIFKKLKVGEHVMWDDQSQAAFDKVKEVMSSPPVLSPPVAGLPLSLYLTVTDTAMGAMLAQTVHQEERFIYYISKSS
ncbi:putative mitochondrial protein AtMg00860 [Silene latifolia]|uniref:putative mitochondrial protein AtMg00860 n=1 Tax=Silene latifolia TaxID=37657 RepID=UPI003D76F694